MDRRKKELFFAFGPNEAYFFSSGPSVRHKGFDDVIKKTPAARRRRWVAVSHKSRCWWHLFQESDGEIQQKRNRVFEDRIGDSLKTWLSKRTDCPLRVVFGPEKGTKLVFVAWVPHANVCWSPAAPKLIQELILSAHRFYTNVRMVALGVDDTFIIIWEDGTIRWNLKEHYNALDNVLNDLNGRGEEVSFVALNASQADGYFIYFDSQTLAMFQVSEAFGEDIEEVLKGEGVRSDAIVRQRKEVVEPLPPTIVPKEKATDFLAGIQKSVGIGASLLSMGQTLSLVVVYAAHCVYGIVLK